MVPGVIDLKESELDFSLMNLPTFHPVSKFTLTSTAILNIKILVIWLKVLLEICGFGFMQNTMLL